MDISFRGRQLGAWFGVAVGDALGAPYEFCPARKLAAVPLPLEMQRGGVWQVGEWTDDTALMLAISHAYFTGTFSPGNAAAAMVEWLLQGPKDVGLLTRHALMKIVEGSATFETAGDRVLAAQPNAAGNGSLMRALPTAVVRAPDDERLIHESAVLSRITHADERCVASCVAYNQVVSSTLRGGDFARSVVLAHRSATQADVRDVLERVANGGAAKYDNDDGIGYVLLALERALLAFRDSNDFESGVTSVFKMGGDTDTNAAIAGGLLGARFGFDAIPHRWVNALMYREVLDTKFKMLCDAKP